MKKIFNPINYALMLFVAFMSILVKADDKNTITAEETNRIIPTSAVAAINLKKM